MTPNLKFVLSSRPIPDCVDALQQYSSLRLEDLTRDDIRAYAVDLLQEKAAYMGHGSEIDVLITEVVNRSCGVFLWVAVVLRSLLAGLRNGDTLAELQTRLEAMPSELRDLYRHMLDKIPPEYRVQAAQMLQLVAANFGRRHGAPGGGFFRPFPALQLFHALESPEKALGKGLRALSRAAAAGRLRQIEARVASRSLGLVEVRVGAPDKLFTDGFRHYEVDFIHRTAMEFVNDAEAAATLDSYTAGSAFDPYLALFASSVSMIKCTELSDRSVSHRRDIWLVHPWLNVKPAMRLASSGESFGSPIPATYLNEFDSALMEHWRGSDFKLMRRLRQLEYQPGIRVHSHLGHWFRLLLCCRSEIRSVPDMFDHQQPPRLFLRHCMLRVSNALTDSKAMGAPASASEGLFEKLTKHDTNLGFLYVAMMGPLPTYLNQQLRDHPSNIGRAELTAALDFLVHNDAFLRFPLSEQILFSERAAQCFELLLEAGANPNQLSYWSPTDYTIWTVFLSFLLLWSPRRRIQVVYVTAENGTGQVERILNAFVRSGADLSVKFKFGASLNQAPLTPRQAVCLIAQFERETEPRDYPFEDGIRRVLALMDERMIPCVPITSPSGKNTTFLEDFPGNKGSTEDRYRDIPASVKRFLMRNLR